MKIKTLNLIETKQNQYIYLKGKKIKHDALLQGVDISVHPGPLTYGLTPMAVQPQGCGQRGQFISLPSDLLDVNKSLAGEELNRLGRNMAHQFFKLRFVTVLF